MRARSGTRPVFGSACSQKYRNERCCRSSINDCAATLPQSRSSHKKAQKAQKNLLVSFRCLCCCKSILRGYLKRRFGKINRIISNHHSEFARLDDITHLTIPKSEMFRAEHKLNSPLLTRLQ